MPNVANFRHAQYIMRRLAWLPIAVLLLAAGQCFRWALADVWATQVSHQLRQPGLSDEEWRLAGQMLGQALRLNPGRASSLELAGQFYQAQAYRQSQPKNVASRQDYRQAALVAFRRAVRLNPAWPYLWGRLALAKVGLQQYDQELSGALDRVAQLGPWEKSLQYDAAVMGLAVAGHLSPLGREALYRAMEQSLTMQTKDAQQTLMAQFKLKNLCADLGAMDNKLPNLSRRCAE